METNHVSSVLLGFMGLLFAAIRPVDVGLFIGCALLSYLLVLYFFSGRHRRRIGRS